jgi:hypothetical protein
MSKHLQTLNQSPGTPDLDIISSKKLGGIAGSRVANQSLAVDQNAGCCFEVCLQTKGADDARGSNDTDVACSHLAVDLGSTCRRCKAIALGKRGGQGAQGGLPGGRSQSAALAWHIHAATRAGSPGFADTGLEAFQQGHPCAVRERSGPKWSVPGTKNSNNAQQNVRQQIQF